MTKKRTLIIVQPYVPLYRVKFFEDLIQTLAQSNIQCRVAAPKVSREMRSRADSYSADWLIQFKEYRLKVGRRNVTLGGSFRLWQKADAVIVGHLGSSLDTSLALIYMRLTGNKVGVWGHIRSYVAKPHPVDAAVERIQLKMANHVFAYTPTGSEYAISAGVRADKVTTVMNSIDTGELLAAQSRLSKSDISRFIEKNGLNPLKTFAFIGGLDASKRIGFLRDSLDIIWQLDPAIRVIVLGAGDQDHLLSSAIDRGQIVKLGYGDASTKTMAAEVSMGLLMPGRVGLVAVDALVLNLPVFTTKWEYHAPEIEYLREGISLFSSENSPEDYANLVVNFASSTKKHESSRASYPKLEDMVKNFSTGVIEMFDLQ